MAKRPLEALTETAKATLRTGANEAHVALETMIVELERRGASAAPALRAGIETRRADGAALLPKLLVRTLAAPDAVSVAVYADALCESGSVYGEFLALTLKGPKSARAAKRLAKDLGHVWLGPMASLLGEIEYELGLPVAAQLERAAPVGFNLAAAVKHPLVRALRRVTRKRSKRTGRSPANAKTYNALVHALLPYGLVELDCGHDAFESALAFDCSRVTHLHALNFVTAGSTLAPAKLPKVTWVEVFVAPGTSGAVFSALSADRNGFLAARRPHLDFAFVGRPTEDEIDELRAASNRWKTKGISIRGKLAGATK